MSISKQLDGTYYLAMYQMAVLQLAEYKEQNTEPQEDDRQLAEYEHRVKFLKNICFGLVDDLFSGGALR